MIQSEVRWRPSQVLLESTERRSPFRGSIQKNICTASEGKYREEEHKQYGGNSNGLETVATCESATRHSPLSPRPRISWKTVVLLAAPAGVVRYTVKTCADLVGVDDLAYRKMHLNSVVPEKRHINRDFIQTNRSELTTLTIAAPLIHE